MANQHRRGRTRKLAAFAAPRTDETVDQLLAAGSGHVLDMFTPFDSIDEHFARVTPAVVDEVEQADPFLAHLIRSNLDMMHGRRPGTAPT